MAMDRREFLGAGVGIAAALTAREAWGKPDNALPKRAWKDGIELSILALGGIVVCGMTQEEASKRVAAAYERGVNYFDCAPSYFNGEAEMKLGKALRPYRSKVFLAEKTGKRDAKGARAELEQTLERFHTDHVDLYQFHAVSSMEDVDKILAPGGAAELFDAAKKEGKAKHLGFSAHNAAAAIQLMEAMELDSGGRSPGLMSGMITPRGGRGISNDDYLHACLAAKRQAPCRIGWRTYPPVRPNGEILDRLDRYQGPVK